MRMPPPKRLEQMIEQAMKDRAPQMHRELKASGGLAKVLTSRAEMAGESYSEASSRAAFEATSAERDLPHQEAVQEMTMAQSRAAEVAIAQATEFEQSPQDETADEIT